ncbi:MAG: DEAD/DEAH box helicase, partial [Desulfobia sp.]
MVQEGDVNEYLASLKASKKFGPQVAYHQCLPAASAAFAELDHELPPELEEVLHTQGVDRLYSHQARAINLIRRTNDVIVATPTASGKSLIYNIPVLEEILNDPGGSALYLFPLKALARDQLRTVENMAAGLTHYQNIRAEVCDGDVSAYRRKKIRENPPHILVSNPDMLHLSMLGYHANWSLFWQRLKYVVIDEVHTYRGVFGSHMAWVIRRMQRICRLHGADPRFLLFSATVGNPEELAQG